MYGTGRIRMKAESSIKIAMQRAYARGYLAGQKNAVRKVKEVIETLPNPTVQK